MPCVTEADERRFVLTAMLSDGIDGASRVIADIAKFGLAMSELHLVRRADGGATLDLCVTASEATDMENIAARFARHVSVVSLSLV